MKTINLRISDVEAAMLNELQSRNRFPRDLGRVFAELVRSKYGDWSKK